MRWLSSSKKDFPKSLKLKRKFSDWFSTFTYFMESRLVVWGIFSNSLFIEYLHTRMDYSQGKHLWRKSFIKYAPKIFVCSIISDKNLTVYIKSFSTNQHTTQQRKYKSKHTMIPVGKSSWGISLTPKVVIIPWAQVWNLCPLDSGWDIIGILVSGLSTYLLFHCFSVWDGNCVDFVATFDS